MGILVRRGSRKAGGKWFSRLGGMWIVFAGAVLWVGTYAFATVGSQPIKIGFGGEKNPNGIPAPWILKVNVNDGVASAKVVREEDEPILHMKSVKSSFSLERPLEADAKEHPYVTWGWKAIALPLEGDVRDKSRNDQVFQLLFAFEDGRILSYVWDANAPEGTVTDESLPWPISREIKVLVVKSGASDAGKWLTVTRNLLDDFKEVFQEEPGRLRGVRVQMNTQYTGGTAEGLVREISSSKTTEIKTSMN